MQKAMDDISDREIDSIAHKIGFDWERIGTFMDYESNQIDALKSIYRDQPVARNARMIKKWADVVASCGESPRTLLAAAFASIPDFEMAQSLVPAEQIEAIRDQEARQETKEKIKLINFDIPGISNSSRRSPVVAIGGEGGINVFDGEVTLGSLSIHPSAGSSMQTLPDTSSLPIGSSMQKGGTGSLNIFGGTVKSDNNQHIQIWQPSLPYNRTSNICRGEGVDVADAAAKSQNSNLKKTIDNTLCDTVWGQYNEIKNSVGALVGWNQLIGTVFRVGSKYVMTAWHCIHAIIDRFKNGDEKLDILKDPQVLITFSYPNVVQNQTAFSILDVPYYDKELDIIILELSEPSKLPPMIKLYFRNIPYMEVQYVDIIGYGHPQSNQKHFDLGCNIIQPSDPVMLEAQAWLQNEKGRLKQGLKQGVHPDSLDRGFHGYDRPEKMIFNCYLEDGSSGGPVLTAKYPGVPVVVGVVTNGLPFCFWDLSSTAQLAFPLKYRFEMGTRMTYIYQALGDFNIALADDLFQ